MFSDLDVDTRARITRTIDGVAICLESSLIVSLWLVRGGARVVDWNGLQHATTLPDCLVGFLTAPIPSSAFTVRWTRRAERLLCSRSCILFIDARGDPRSQAEETAAVEG